MDGEIKYNKFKEAWSLELNIEGFTTYKYFETKEIAEQVRDQLNEALNNISQKQLVTYKPKSKKEKHNEESRTLDNGLTRFKANGDIDTYVKSNNRKKELIRYYRYIDKNDVFTVDPDDLKNMSKVEDFSKELVKDVFGIFRKMTNTLANEKNFDKLHWARISMYREPQKAFTPIIKEIKKKSAAIVGIDYIEDMLAMLDEETFNLLWDYHILKKSPENKKFLNKYKVSSVRTFWRKLKIVETKAMMKWLNTKNLYKVFDYIKEYRKDDGRDLGYIDTFSELQFCTLR